MTPPLLRSAALRPRAAAMAALLALAACMPDPADPADPDKGADKATAASPVIVQPKDTCGAYPQIILVGENVEGRSFDGLAPIVRLIGPRQAVTKDYRPERLNIMYDDDGIIMRLYCG